MTVGPNAIAGQSVLGRTSVSTRRQHLELWRAVITEQGETLARQLSSPVVAQACGLAATSRSPQEATAALSALLAREITPFAFDLAARALRRACAARGGARGFAKELFAEATTYFASAHLSSAIGGRDMIADPAQMVRLGEELQKVTRDMVAEFGDPHYQGNQWPFYVGKVLDALAGVRKP